MMPVQQESRVLARLETSSGELVCQIEIKKQEAPLLIVLGQRVFAQFFPGNAVTVYREAEEVYVAG